MTEDERRLKEVLASVLADPHRLEVTRQNVVRQALQWGESVRIQGDRVGAAADDQVEREMDLLVLAIAGLLSMARMCEKLGLDLAGALDAFDEAAPQARNARDVFSHLAEYSIGAGRLQEGDRAPVQITYSRSPAAGTAIVMSHPEIALDVGIAKGAAIAVTEVLSAQLTGGAAIATDF